MCVPLCVFVWVAVKEQERQPLCVCVVCITVKEEEIEPLCVCACV